MGYHYSPLTLPFGVKLSKDRKLMNWPRLSLIALNDNLADSTLSKDELNNCILPMVKLILFPLGENSLTLERDPLNDILRLMAALVYRPQLRESEAVQVL